MIGAHLRFSGFKPRAKVQYKISFMLFHIFASRRLCFSSRVCEGINLFGIVIFCPSCLLKYSLNASFV